MTFTIIQIPPGNIIETRLLSLEQSGTTVSQQEIDRIRVQFPQKPFYAVFGGFHLMNKHPRNIQAILNAFKDLGVQKAGPTHCSGNEAEEIFRKNYGKDFLAMKAGELIDI